MSALAPGSAWVILLLTVGGELLAGRLCAQSAFQPMVMQTGSGNILLTQTMDFISPAGGSGIFKIDFGFATAEQPQPGLFGDSVTISLSGPSGLAPLVTVDANGPIWAPELPGALPVAESSIQRTATSFLAPSEGLPVQLAFEMGYSLPANWQGVPLQMNIDLFDNQNQQPSLAYYVPLVPEPGSLTLWLLGLLFGSCFRAKRLFTSPR